MTAHRTDSYYITFVSVAGSYDATGPDIPSPGRVLGALLAAAYRTGNNQVINAVRTLPDSPNADIIVSEIPQLSYQVESYQALNLDKWKSSKIALPGGGNGRAERTTQARVIDKGAFFSYQVIDGPDPDLIQEACDALSYFGKGSDTFTAFVETTRPQGLRLKYSPRARSGYRLRTWEPETLNYYDFRYEMVERKQRFNTVNGSHLPEGTWRLSYADETTAWWPIPLRKRTHQFNAPRILKDIISWQHPTARPLVTVDMAGMIQGVLVPYEDNGTAPEVKGDSSWFDFTRQPLRVHTPDYWTRSTGTWVSATPMIGHPDPNVVVWQLEQQGFTVTRISKQPFHYSQGQVKNSISAPTPYVCWWLQIEGAHSGALTVGECTNLGAGVMRPVSPNFSDSTKDK